MNKLVKSALLTGVSALLLMGTNTVMAQPAGGGGGGRGNFDPAQMQQRMLERYKETLKVTDDAEWKVLSEKLTKVMTARRDAGGFGGMMGGRRGGPGGGGQDASADTTPLGELRKALEGSDSALIKTKLAAYREYRAKKQAELKAAQEELKRVLTAKQEGQLVAEGVVE